MYCFLTAAIPDDIPGANPCGDRNFRRYESAICDFPGIRPGYDHAANSSAASFLIVFYRLVLAIFRRLPGKLFHRLLGRITFEGLVVVKQDDSRHRDARFFPTGSSVSVRGLFGRSVTDVGEIPGRPGSVAGCPNNPSVGSFSGTAD